jgi:hypothetical protein
MPSLNPPDFKSQLIGKRVIVKVSLFGRAFAGTIVASDDIGFCIASGDMVNALREITGTLMSDMDAPHVYLPFAKLEWLVSSEPKAAAATNAL